MKGDMTMKFFTKIIKFVKKAFRKIVKMLKDKNPVEVINDATKTAAALATTGLALYTGVNAIRVHFAPSIKKNNNYDSKSAHEIIFENRSAGSIDEKLAIIRKNNSRMGKSNISTIKSDDLKVLESIAKTRNSFFQSLSAEEQMNILEMEDFDFKSYSKEMKKKSRFKFFKNTKQLNKFGCSDKNKAFRENVNYGFFNFILQPIDDFIHWLKNDPVPKKVPQIQVIDHPEIPNIPCETALDLVSTARNLDSYLNHNKTVSSEFNVTTPEEVEEQQILAGEIFRHKTLSKFKKAVNRCMAQSNFNTPNIFDLMDDEKDFKKKKKNKKKHSYDDDFSFMDSNKSKKKKNKGMSKEDREAESLADKRAKALYRYHLEKAMNGEFDRKGYGFDF
jgi:hypothetical protein